MIIAPKYVLTNENAQNAITEQFDEYKREKTSRVSRMQFADKLIEDYFALHLKLPPTGVLDRLATLILQDEIADATPWKSRNNEYHIQSPREELDYYKGLVAKNVPESVATDGADYRLPTRRQRTPSENAHIDREMGGKRRNDYKSSSSTLI